MSDKQPKGSGSKKTPPQAKPSPVRVSVSFKGWGDEGDDISKESSVEFIPKIEPEQQEISDQINSKTNISNQVLNQNFKEQEQQEIINFPPAAVAQVPKSNNNKKKQRNQKQNNQAKQQSQQPQQEVKQEIKDDKLTKVEIDIEQQASSEINVIQESQIAPNVEILSSEPAKNQKIQEIQNEQNQNPPEEDFLKVDQINIEESNKSCEISSDAFQSLIKEEQNDSKIIMKSEGTNSVYLSFVQEESEIQNTNENVEPIEPVESKEPKEEQIIINYGESLEEKKVNIQELVQENKDVVEQQVQPEVEIREQQLQQLLKSPDPENHNSAEPPLSNINSIKSNDSDIVQINSPTQDDRETAQKIEEEKLPEEEIKTTEFVDQAETQPLAVTHNTRYEKIEDNILSSDSSPFKKEIVRSSIEKIENPPVETIENSRIQEEEIKEERHPIRNSTEKLEQSSSTITKETQSGGGGFFEKLKNFQSKMNTSVLQNKEFKDYQNCRDRMEEGRQLLDQARILNTKKSYKQSNETIEVASNILHPFHFQSEDTLIQEGLQLLMSLYLIQVQNHIQLKQHVLAYDNILLIEDYYDQGVKLEELESNNFQNWKILLESQIECQLEARKAEQASKTSQILQRLNEQNSLQRESPSLEKNEPDSEIKSTKSNLKNENDDNSSGGFGLGYLITGGVVSTLAIGYIIKKVLFKLR